jgi:Gpi18-like mannosyltransferase
VSVTKDVVLGQRYHTELPGVDSTDVPPIARDLQKDTWVPRDVAVLALVLVAATISRLALLPTRGLAGDIDQFAGWVHHIAINGLPNAYDQDLAFGPVLAYIWGLIAAVDPAFRSTADASDPAIAAVMKLPASLADLGIGLLVAYALRARPASAIAGAALILLHPAVIDVSAWWGQYESIYLLTAVAAVVAAVNGRNGWAAAAIALSVLTKPQAVALLLPFAAWFWATEGWRGVARASAVGGGVVILLWLPFIAAGGPFNYVHDLGEYQGEVFNVLSLRAWNIWWLVQEGTAGGAFIRDDQAILGPLTLRYLGYAVAGLLEVVIAAAVIRRPTPDTLILGLTASVLVFFSFATQMHERYAYGALVFLAVLVAAPATRWLSLVFGVAFTLNLLAAIPPIPEIGAVLPVAGPLGVAGSITMLAVTFAALRMLVAAPPGPGGVPGLPAP